MIFFVGFYMTFVGKDLIKLLLTEEVEVIINGRMAKYYEESNYIIPRKINKYGKLTIPKGTKIFVKIKDLTIKSNEHIEVLCDYCKINISTKEYNKYLKEINDYNMNICNECKYKRMPELIFNKYGVNNVNQLDWVKEKKKQTNLSKFGFEYPLQSIKVKNKKKETNLNKYGVDNYTKTNEYKEKYRETSLNKYGVTHYRKTQEYKESHSGENSPNWKGGITSKNIKIRDSEEYKEWRLAVFTRDSFTCQRCGDSTGSNLRAHHIENFSSNEELRLNIDNGITLCNKCHDPNKINSFHNIYGTKNNTPEQLDEYINNYKKSHQKMEVNIFGGVST